LKISAIITAAGAGRRFGEKKQFKILCGSPLYFYSLKTFIKIKIIDEVILVVPSEIKTLIEKKVKTQFGENVKVISGGSSRANSVKNGVLSSSKNSDLILIHDAARPFVNRKLISDSINACKNADGSIIALKATDTLKHSKSGYVKKTINRNEIWLAQTPQAFKKKKLLKAYQNEDYNSSVFTDESSIMEQMGYKIALVQGSSMNFKITTIDDWQKAKRLLK
tara:strand:+ start:515 stop:1180 length:666 start_codon:yes stop_codon:yes gene_type:complete